VGTAAEGLRHHDVTDQAHNAGREEPSSLSSPICTGGGGDVRPICTGGERSSVVCCSRQFAAHQAGGAAGHPGTHPRGHPSHMKFLCISPRLQRSVKTSTCPWMGPSHVKDATGVATCGAIAPAASLRARACRTAVRRARAAAGGRLEEREERGAARRLDRDVAGLRAAAQV